MKPKAVMINDLHFTPSTLELATTSLKLAQAKAIELNVPLIIAGDTLDTKAIIRAECANRLIEILEPTDVTPDTYILVGNHDLLSEKAKSHSLNFLDGYGTIIDAPRYLWGLGLHLIPYMSNTSELEALLKTLNKGSTLIMHQGVKTAYMGHYVQDKSSLSPEAFKDFTVLSGHYHRKQVIDTGDGRTFTYTGTPYSTSFAEANDGPKGFHVIQEDNSIDFIPTNLRKHIVIEMTTTELNYAFAGIHPEDLIWVKFYGARSVLDKLDKQAIGMRIFGHTNYKLDKIYSDEAPLQSDMTQMTGEEILDSIIESTDESETQREYLKSLWREII